MGKGVWDATYNLHGPTCVENSYQDATYIYSFDQVKQFKELCPEGGYFLFSVVNYLFTLLIPFQGSLSMENTNLTFIHIQFISYTVHFIACHSDF